MSRRIQREYRHAFTEKHWQCEADFQRRSPGRRPGLFGDEPIPVRRQAKTTRLDFSLRVRIRLRYPSWPAD